MNIWFIVGIGAVAYAIYLSKEIKRYKNKKDVKAVENSNSSVNDCNADDVKVVEEKPNK